MKKRLPYIIIGAALILIVVLIASAKRMSAGQKKFEKRISLRQRDKIPYGMSAARQLLPSLIPDATIYSEDKAPGHWNTISQYSTGQAVVLVAKHFDADEFEVNRLLHFAKQGNHVFIIAKSFSEDAQREFGLNISEGLGAFVEYADIDSVSVKLEKSSFSTDKIYSFPGVRYESWFNYFDSTHAIVLGRNAANQPNFIQMKIGAGTVSIHTAPIAFSNYFVLHKNNTEYFEKAFSVIPADVNKLVWDEYYLIDKQPAKKREALFRVLFRYPAFKWGLLVAAATLVIYLLFFMRRRQRPIPLYEKPKNDSMDFVKTMGRLYYERRDHRNLSLKMAMYFLEHVRSSYKLPTHQLDKEFEAHLHYKSGYSQQGIEDIIAFIRNLKTGEQVTEMQLAKFHDQLESFYQNT